MSSKLRPKDYLEMAKQVVRLQSPTRAPSGGPQFFSNAVIANGGTGDGFFGLPTVTSPVNGQAVLPTPGNLGRNTFTGPGWSNLDFSLVKDTKITESKLVTRPWVSLACGP